jgi:hypothetical protein
MVSKKITAYRELEKIYRVLGDIKSVSRVEQKLAKLLPYNKITQFARGQHTCR